ncbi:hypothetical protein BHM03_00039632 [Ensete ventricosum]|nr:hypothetical protein BHM03_00039632 [Ensete ventricosum]
MIGCQSRDRFTPDRKSGFATELVQQSGRLRGLPQPGAVAAPPRVGSPGSGPQVTLFAEIAWTWFVRPRKSSAVTTNGAGLDAGEGNPGCRSFYSKGYEASVPEVLTAPVAYHALVFRRSLRGPCGEARGVHPATGECRSCPPYPCQVGRTTVDPPMLVSGRFQSRWVGHVVGSAVRKRGDVIARSTSVISPMIPPPPPPQGISPPPPPEEAPPLPNEPEPKRQRVDDVSLIQEDQFLARHPVK